jgi:hypothetical protein
MKYFKPAAAVLAFLLFIQCDTPGSPDFTLSSDMDIPLISNSRFQVLGGADALIDTTKEDMENLFSTDGDNFITLSKRENFDFRDLEDAIPAVDTEPALIDSRVGEISLSDFSSQDGNGNLGEAGFSDLTGQPFQLQEGDPLPAAQTPSPVNIDLTTNFFESATITNGGIDITITNELGFDIDLLSLELFSGSNSVGVINFTNLLHNTTGQEFLPIVENSGIDPDVVLSDLNVDVEIEWSTQTMQDDGGSIIVNRFSGNNLTASQVVAAIPSQEFFSSDIANVETDEFIFSQPDHFIEVETGELLISDILNSIDVDIEVLEISFPDILTPPYSPADSLVVRFDGSNSIPGNNTSPVSREISLADTRFFAFNNQVEYNIYALTEDTRAGDGSELRTISEDDQVTANVQINNLQIREVFGQPANRQIVLNEDDPSNGNIIDLSNDAEADSIDIDGISDLSEKLEGIEFTDSNISIEYSTNIDIPVTIIGAFLGMDANGDQFFLSGMDGTNQQVQPSDPTERLYSNGAQIANSDLIKFDLNPSDDPQIISTVTFNKDNSNITEFLNRLPTSIRFIGVADINKNNDVGRLVNPVTFDPEFIVNIPLSFRADQASYTDTTETDLGNLPGPDDDSMIETGSLRIQYQNNIPLGVDLSLNLLDEFDQSITIIPMQSEPAIQFQAAQTGSDGFSNAPSEDVSLISLSRSQLDEINKTRKIRINATLGSTNQSDVKIRDIDDIQFSISGKFSIDTEVN